MLARPATQHPPGQVTMARHRVILAHGEQSSVLELGRALTKDDVSRHPLLHYRDAEQATPDAGELTREERWLALGYGGATVWLTGLPAAGKSTIGAGVEKRLVAQGRPGYLLDGDNLRHGLNGDLDFSRSARSENSRRSGHVACLLADAGIVAVVALISPYAADRDQVRELHEAAGLPFIEGWIATPLTECERRDPKGLYARARGGSLKGLTGVDDPYEPPPRPELIIEPPTSVEAAVDDIVGFLARVAA